VNARQEILARIERALGDQAPAPTIPRNYHGPGEALAQSASSVDLVGRFEERVLDYRAAVHRCAPDAIAATVTAVRADRGIGRIIAPDGLPSDWLPDGIGDQPPLSIDDLDQLDGVLTVCSVAIAETGTIVLDHGPGQGRRALTLVPDHHLVVVRADQIVYAVPDAIARLDPLRPLTWISGPSATSDIELSRVEGVHGPRKLDVLLVT
jgi:L-lactate dehydrogenase complex protein LldG